MIIFASLKNDTMTNNIPAGHAKEDMDVTDKHMGWRGKMKNYCWPGIYHITINVLDRKNQPLGHISGDVNRPDGDPLAPRVVLSDIGKMVEQELLQSIRAHYPMVEVQDYVVMPDHLHFIVEVHRNIISSNGRETHLGQVIAGFKKGCNRRYWELTGQEVRQVQGEPANACADLPSAVHLRGSKLPSTASTGRPPLFDYGYVDVMPLKEGQLERQREYIRNNPRYRLMRQNNHKCLQPQRATVTTALKLSALKGYLERECGRQHFNDEIWEGIRQRLLTDGDFVTCDSYGNIQLLSGRLLPVVCHRKDASLFEIHKSCCLSAAASGAVLVSARIAKGEHDIIDTATQQDYPVVTVEDNGFPTIYHPSERRIKLCADNKLLIVSPWKYAYRHVDDTISVAACKTMNCIVQALCRTKDSWWKGE